LVDKNWNDAENVPMKFESFLQFLLVRDGPPDVEGDAFAAQNYITRTFKEYSSKYLDPQKVVYETDGDGWLRDVLYIRGKLTTSLIRCVECEDSYGLVNIYLKDGADPNLRDNWRKSALHYAASTKQADVIEILLEYGALIDEKDNFLKFQLWKMGFQIEFCNMSPLGWF
jgi:ankyrin repeat protein